MYFFNHWRLCYNFRKRSGDENLKSDYEITLDKNFDRALELCSAEHSYDELIGFLKDGNIPEKQFAALEISELKSQEDAGIFLSNLINCDGKIREAVAQKFSEFVGVKECREYFYNYPDILAKATIDINANISRMVIEGLTLMRDNEDFGSGYVSVLLEYINEAFEGLDKIVFRDKKYTINKQLFKLYWCLEGVSFYYKYLPVADLKRVLTKTLEQTEYTVREKAAQIIRNIDDENFSDIKAQILKDDNYYIKRIIGD